MSDWEVQDNTGTGKGYLTLTCDGKRVCDFFPFAKDADPEWVKIQAYRIRDRMRSFFDGLTDEQKKLALEYDGPEDHGDPAYKRS